MSRGTGWVVGAALVAAALAAWILLRTGTLPEADTVANATPVLHASDDGTARAPGPGTPPTPIPVPTPLADSRAPGPAPASDPGKPTLLVRWTGAPMPMDRDPLPEFDAQPSSGAARLAGRLVKSPLAVDDSAVMLELGAGSYDLALRSGGAAVWRDRRELLAGPTEIMLDASRLPGIVGRCVDERGNSLEGVTVRINSVLTSSVVSVASGADGSFHVPFLSAELLFDGKASKPGFLEVSAEPLQLEPDRVTVMDVFVMRPARAVSGRVQLQDGTPVARCPVRAVVVKFARSQATTDDDGRFRFDELPAGEVRVFTEHSMLRDACLVLPDAVEERHAVLVLDEGVFIDGTARSEDGSPTGFLWIEGVPLAPAGGTAPDREATSQSTQIQQTPGSFRLGPFPPGPVEVSDAFHTIAPRVVNAPGSMELVVPVQRVLEVALRFTDATTGLPITKPGSYSVLIISAAGNGSMGGPSFTPDAHGVWTLRRQLSSAVQASLVVRFGGYLPARVDALETVPAQAPPLEVTVQPDPGFNVRVLDASGAPVSGASVFVAWHADAASMSEHMANGLSFANRAWFADGRALVSNASTDAEGFSRMPRLGDGAMVCVVSAEGFLSWFQRFAGPPSASGTPATADASAPPDLRVTLTPTP